MIPVFALLFLIARMHLTQIKGEVNLFLLTVNDKGKANYFFESRLIYLLT